MRKSAKVLLLAVVSFFGTIALCIGSAFSAAFAFGAVALIVPGTGDPDPASVNNYLENARNYYLGGTACGAPGQCEGDDLQGIQYPASFWPLIIFPTWCRSGPDGCDTWDESVGKGADALTQSLQAALGVEGQQVVVFGYSQGGAVVSKTLHDYPLTDEEKARIQVVTIGGIENPDGGLWQRLAFLRYIPILNVTFDPPMPVDPLLKTTTFGFEYDPVVYAPKYFGNPFALLNAIAAFETVHGAYLAPDGPPPPAVQDALPYGYTPETLAPQLVCNLGVNCREDQYHNQYIMIPATSLPIMDLIQSTLPNFLSPVVKPLVDLTSPVYKVLADLGYDWSGDPGVPTPLSILPFNPFQNWLGVGLNLAAAAGQGVQAFLGDLGAGGGSTMLAPATTPEPTSLLAARSFAPDTEQLEPEPANDTASNVTEPAAKKSAPAVVAADTPPVTQPAETEFTPTVPTDEVKKDETVTVDTPKTDETVSKDDSKTDESVIKDDTEKDESVTKDDSKKDQSVAKDDSKKDASETKADDAKKDDAKKDDVKKDEPKKDAPENKAA